MLRLVAVLFFQGTKYFHLFPMRVQNDLLKVSKPRPVSPLGNLAAPFAFRAEPQPSLPARGPGALGPVTPSPPRLPFPSEVVNCFPSPKASSSVILGPFGVHAFLSCCFLTKHHTFGGLENSNLLFHSFCRYEVWHDVVGFS